MIVFVCFSIARCYELVIFWGVVVVLSVAMCIVEFDEIRAP
jgi:hypothetical protein